MQSSTYDNVPLSSSNTSSSSGRSTPMSTRRSNLSSSQLASSSLSPTSLPNSPFISTRVKSPSPSRRISSSTTTSFDSTSTSTPSSKSRHPSSSKSSSLSSYPSLDEDAIEDLLLKYTSTSTSNCSSSTLNFPTQLTTGLDFAAGSQKKINALLANWLPKTKNWIS